MKNVKRLKFLDAEGNIYVPSVGDNVEFRPGVYCIVRNKKNQVLMIIDKKSNKWEFPGGGLEVGEDLIDCGIREVKEETGYSIVINDEIHLCVEKNLAYFKTIGKFKHKLDFYYLAEVIEGLPIVQNLDDGEEILKVEWIDIDKLSELDIWFRQISVLKKFLKSI